MSNDAEEPLLAAIREIFPNAQITTSIISQSEPLATLGFQYDPPFKSVGMSMHKLGWAVIPQQRSGKRLPAKVDGEILKWGQWTEIGPETEDVKRWRILAAHENVAVILGPPSGNSFCIDIDVLSEDLSRAIQRTAKELLGETPIRRVGQWPKMALLYRAAEGDLPKNQSKTFVALEGERDVHRLEILGKGKLITLQGFHHKTGQSFQYMAANPIFTGPEELPIVSSEAVDAFIKAVAKLRAFTSSTPNTSAFRSLDITSGTLQDGNWFLPPLRADVEFKNGLVSGNREAWLSSMAFDLVRFNPDRVCTPLLGGGFAFFEEGLLAAVDVLCRYAEDSWTADPWNRDLREDAHEKLERVCRKLVSGELNFVSRSVGSKSEHRNTLNVDLGSEIGRSGLSETENINSTENTGTPTTPNVIGSPERAVLGESGGDGAGPANSGAEPAGVPGVPVATSHQKTNTSSYLPAVLPSPPVTTSDEHGVPHDGYISFGGYVSNHQGVFFIPSDGRDETPIQVCGPLQVLALSRQHDGTDWGLLLEWPDYDGKVHQTVLTRALLVGNGEASRTLLMSSGLHIPASKSSRDHMLRYLEKVFDYVKPRRVVALQTGWHGSEFVTPGKIYSPHAYSTLAFSSDSPVARPFVCSGSLTGWQEDIGRLAVGNSRLMLALGTAFAAPLLTRVGVQGGGVHLRGSSSSGKTTLARAAVSVYSSPSFQQTWRSTANGLEGIAAARNDALLVLDELGQCAPHQVGEATYMLSNGEGKLRGSPNGAARQSVKFRVMVLSTGELSLADKIAEDRFSRARAMAGQEVRLLDLPADTDHHGVFEDLHGFENGAALSKHIVKATSREHGTPFAAFMQNLVAIEESNWSLLQERVAQLTTEMLNGREQGQLQRAAERFAVIALGAELASHFGIGPWTQQDAFNGVQKCFEAWVLERGGSESTERKQAIIRIRDFVSRHISRFELVYETDDPEMSKGAPLVKDRAGFLFLRGERKTFGFLASGFAEALGGMNSTLAAKDLAAKGFLQGPDSANKWSISKTVQGSKFRLYLVNDSIFEAE
jgi:uncharacterized protein (DUF927 family)